MDFDHKKIMPRFFVVIVLMSLGGLYILGNAAYLMFVESGYWSVVSDKFITDDVALPAKRGNILSDDGEIMASSLPEFKIYMDFVAYDRDPKAARKLQAWRDSVFDCSLDSIAEGLANIFPDKSFEYFRRHLLKGKAEHKRHWPVYGKRITYIQYCECKKLPLFRESKGRGGFHIDTYNLRKKPYGSLATRTLGDLYAGKDSARYGLELSFDSLLRGVPGVSHRVKVRNKWLNIADEPASDGFDLVTTIDVALQDAAEKALLKKLKEINGEVGIAVLMEVATGDVKAIVNMTKCADGEYYEIKNNAVSDLLEPGSTFKTASIMVALEDGKISTSDYVETGNGQWEMHRRIMKDHNWHKGGYGRLSVPEVLMFSSNVGVSRLIDENYGEHPEEFVDGLYREGVGLPLNLPLQGAGEPRVRRPNADGSNWSKTALPWMSIGYETQLPPIATLTFYNAIANDGCMVRPRFVKAIMKNGEVVREFPVEVIKESICSAKTLREIRDILELVVSKGLGSKAGNKDFKVSGKTGTAQVAEGQWGYSRRKYHISFCGFFPSDEPKYSCIVSIQKHGLPASGGGQCGPVFREISKAAMSQGVYRDVAEAADSTSVFVPEVFNGNMSATQAVLSELGIPFHLSGGSSGDVVWGKASITDNAVVLTGEQESSTMVPDVLGMGARDAVFLLESRGLNVRLSGVGRVVSQSIPPASLLKKGQTIHINLKK